MSSLIPVVLSGGSGTRLWPLSRRQRPKQFQRVIGTTTMLAQTLDRLSHLGVRPLVMANVSQVPQLRECLGSDRSVSIIAEPAARNTAPAIAAAAVLAHPDDILVVMPADHHISQPAAFTESLERAIAAAASGQLATFGVVPGKPETGYGYIVPQTDASMSASPIERFVEKPSREEAAELIAVGALWNSGMFVFPAGILLAELDRLTPELLTTVRAALASATEQDFGLELGPEFATAPAVSIDTAVMEHTARAVVVPLEAGWSDIGSWETLWELGEKDPEDNVITGSVLALDSRGSYLRSDGPLVAVAGVDDLVVVATADAVLVTRRHASQDVKKLVERLGEEYL
jgi:mannose-1-phosphate guanylyltransferase/mannose-1-phosphate guanylyltransferase/mannose-6-phosphate isomerase